MTLEFWIQKADIQQTHFRTIDPAPTLAPHHIRVRINHFALTANNITYAVSGDRIGYWQFFPTGQAEWGKLPVWGFATVEASAHDAIAVGERLFGFFPLATHLTIEAEGVTAHRVIDAAAHRQELNPVYNQYVRVDHTAGFEPQHDYFNALLRPMFITSFLLDDFAADQVFFGAEAVILTSASSKTAYSTAYLLHRNRQSRPPIQIIGLTSESNVGFVESLGCYDVVLPYAKATDLAADMPVMVMDFSGNAALRMQLHQHFGDQLRHNAGIGITDWQAMGSTKGLPGVKPQMFFAPAQVQKRVEEWGAQRYQQNLNAAWLGFVDAASDWVDVVAQSGQDAIQATYQKLLSGQVSPREGFILSWEVL